MGSYSKGIYRHFSHNLDVWKISHDFQPASHEEPLSGDGKTLKRQNFAPSNGGGVGPASGCCLKL